MLHSTKTSNFDTTMDILGEAALYWRHPKRHGSPVTYHLDSIFVSWYFIHFFASRIYSGRNMATFKGSRDKAREESTNGCCSEKKSMISAIQATDHCLLSLLTAPLIGQTEPWSISFSTKIGFVVDKGACTQGTPTKRLTVQVIFHPCKEITSCIAQYQFKETQEIILNRYRICPSG